VAVESAILREGAGVTNLIELTSPKWEEQRDLIAAARHLDVAVWVGRATVDKYHGDFTADQIDAGLAGVPYERVVGTPQLLTYGGASCLWQCLIGNGTATGAQTLTYFNNGNAHAAVGDSSTAAAATQTDLQASTNKLRKAQDATYPQHTDATTSGAASIVFRSTFGSSDANFAWAEWAIFNGSSGGRMLNRKVESLGTKASGSSWVLTLTLTLA
jgi:hypothetical protein